MQNRLEGSHARSSAFNSKKRAMIAAVCSQSRFSASSTLRPAPRQPIKAGPAVVFRGTPVRRNRSLLLQPQQDGIQRALVDRKQVAADLLDASRHAIPVQRPQHIEGLQDHQGERSLLDILFLFHAASWPWVHLACQQEDAPVPLGKQQGIAQFPGCLPWSDWITR